MDDFSLWTEASRDVEAETRLRSLTAARVRAAAFWPFLAAADTVQDFENRLHLAGDKVVAAADSTGITAEALCDSLREDFASLKSIAYSGYRPGLPSGGGAGYGEGNTHPETGYPHQYADRVDHPARAAYNPPTHPDHPGYADYQKGVRDGHNYGLNDKDRENLQGNDSPSHYHMGLMDGHNYANGAQGIAQNVRGGGERDFTRAEPQLWGRNRGQMQGFGSLQSTSAFYVETADGEKVGGPYDDKAAAQAAIDGGDVEGEGLTVAQGDSDGGDQDGDGKPDAEEPDTDKDGEPDDSDSDDDGDGASDFPFAKKDASRKTAGGYDSMSDHWAPNPAGGATNYVGSGSAGTHPTPPRPGFDQYSTDAQHRSTVMQFRQDAIDAHPSMHDTECANCGGTHMSGEMHVDDNACPHCGADSSHLRETDGAHDYDWPDHGEAHSEDNYGDPYGRMDAYDMHMRGSRLFPVVALQEGVDPLIPIVQSVPGGEGQAEKEVHHGEYEEHPDNSLVNQFTSLYRKYAGR